MVSWEKSHKKEGAYPKREIDTERLQKNTDRLQQSDIDYKVYELDYKRLQKSDIDYKGQRKTTKVSSVCFFRLQRFVVSAFWDYNNL